jgi:hypothetical protein
MNPRVLTVEPQTGYRLKVSFDNGEVGIYDCRSLLTFGVFQELENEEYFRQVRVEGGTIVWPHEQDICPDTVYLESDRRLETMSSKRLHPTAKRRR